MSQLPPDTMDLELEEVKIEKRIDILERLINKAAGISQQIDNLKKRRRNKEQGHNRK